jgi:hypothetical protein
VRSCGASGSAFGRASALGGGAPRPFVTAETSAAGGEAVLALSAALGSVALDVRVSMPGSGRCSRYASSTKLAITASDSEPSRHEAASTVRSERAPFGNVIVSTPVNVVAFAASATLSASVPARGSRKRAAGARESRSASNSARSGQPSVALNCSEKSLNSSLTALSAAGAAATGDTCIMPATISASGRSFGTPRR